MTDFILLAQKDAVGEDGFRKGNMRFQDEGVVALHGGAWRADGDDAGDVGGAVLVLAAGVDEEQAVAAYFAVVFRGGAIMGHSLDRKSVV